MVRWEREREGRESDGRLARRGQTRLGPVRRGAPAYSLGSVGSFVVALRVRELTMARLFQERERTLFPSARRRLSPKTLDSADGFHKCGQACVTRRSSAPCNGPPCNPRYFVVNLLGLRDDEAQSGRRSNFRSHSIPLPFQWFTMKTSPPINAPFRR